MFLQTILTKCIHPTRVRHARVKAYTSGSDTSSDPDLQLFLPWDHEVSTETNHIRAAKELAQQLDWTHRYSGGPVDSKGLCYVFTPIQEQPAFDTRY
jgi:hypothetical protein